MGLLSSASGKLEDLESKKDDRIGQMAEFIIHLQTMRDEADEMLEEVDEARERIDQVEEDAKSVKEFVDQLPSFNGGDNN